MKECSFLITDGFRTNHIKADSLREAFKITKNQYPRVRFSGLYIDCREGDYVMSHWKPIKDKSIKWK